jgi:hypothetical protein
MSDCEKNKNDITVKFRDVNTPPNVLGVFPDLQAVKPDIEFKSYYSGIKTGSESRSKGKGKESDVEESMAVRAAKKPRIVVGETDKIEFVADSRETKSYCK